MSQIIFPRDQIIFEIDSQHNPVNRTIALKCGPQNTIIYFDTASNINSISGSTFVLTASWSDTASFALSTGGASNLITNSLVPITASQAVSASWAPFTDDPNAISASWVSASVFITTAQTASYVSSANVSGKVATAKTADTASYFIETATTLNTGSTYPVTSSWSVSSSWSPPTDISGKQNVLITGSTLPLSSSWANNIAAANVIGTVTSASYSVTASFATNAGTAGGTTLSTGSTYQVTASWALSASQAVSASWAPFVDNPNATSASYATFAQTFPAVLVSGSLYQITSSYSNTASVYLGSVTSASFATNTYTASYILAGNVSGKVSTAVTADSASYIQAANIAGTVANSTSASYSLFASTVPAVLVSGSLYQITSSYSQTASLLLGSVVSASFATNTYTSSYILAGNVSGKVATATTADTASYLVTALTASYVQGGNVAGKVSQSTTADTASLVLGSNVSGKVASAINSDTASVYLGSVVSSSYSQTASFSNNFYSTPWRIYNDSNNNLTITFN